MAVKTKMAADPIVKAYALNVKTKKGVVTLSGDVDTSVAHEQAVKITRDAGGVQDIIDHVHVRDTAATTGYLDRTEKPRKR
jgi:hyperosmotically inducible protein